MKNGNIASLGIESLTIGFKVGFYARSDISAWVDAHILAGDSLDGPLLELATLSELSDQDIFGQLRVLSGQTSPTEIDEAVATRIELAMIGQMVASGRMQLGRAISRMFDLRHRDVLSSEEENTINHLHYGYELAVDKVTDTTLADVRADFVTFTKKYGHLIV